MNITAKAARINIGMSREEACEKLGIAMYAIRQIEASGKYPPVNVAVDMAKLYGVPFDNLSFGK